MTFRVGIYLNPTFDDAEFNNRQLAEEYCQKIGRKNEHTAYAVWNDDDDVIYLYFQYQAFVPARL